MEQGVRPSAGVPAVGWNDLECLALGYPLKRATHSPQCGPVRCPASDGRLSVQEVLARNASPLHAGGPQIARLPFAAPTRQALVRKMPEAAARDTRAVPE
jgi:hypothetical protein